jgi:flagellar basal-body rod modification protein FlgD
MTTVPSATDAQSKSSPDNSAAASNSLLNPDFNLFLQMLTTQMQNQDPLDPMDTSEYTQQLVQYSQVEQEMQQSTTLNNILGALGSQGMTQASAFIGREARFDTDVSGLQGSTAATWSYASSSTKPVSLEATIKDANGKVVATADLDPSSDGRYSWDGKMADGSQAPDGAYELTLDAKDADGNDVPMVINSVGIVKDVVTDGTNVMLGVNGLRLSMSGLVAVSAPGDDESASGG